MSPEALIAHVQQRRDQAEEAVRDVPGDRGGDPRLTDQLLRLHHAPLGSAPPAGMDRLVRRDPRRAEGQEGHEGQRSPSSRSSLVARPGGAGEVPQPHGRPRARRPAAGDAPGEGAAEPRLPAGRRASGCGLDVYRPRRARGALPAVLLGGPPGPASTSGQKVGWAQLIAASGMAAVTFDIRSSGGLQTPEQPAGDVQAAVALRPRAGEGARHRPHPPLHARLLARDGAVAPVGDDARARAVHPLQRRVLRACSTSKGWAVPDRRGRRR